MSRDFLHRLFGRKSTAGVGPSVRIAAFGKHPGWNDHIEDLSLDTDHLVLVKRLLYVEGIGGNIDSGAWEALDPEQRIEGYGHTFLWSFGDSFIVGRMWTSSDGKGRTRYPMVVAADITNVDAGQAVSVAMPVLLEFEQACLQTTQRVDVVARLEEARVAAKRALANAPAPKARDPMMEFLDTPDLGPQRIGLYRILYQIEREMSAYRRNAAEGSSARIKSVDLRPQHMRVPACLNDPLESLLIWDSFLKRELDPMVPLLLVRHQEFDWVDVMVGGPGTAQFFCLKAKRKAVPLATEVPYSLDQAFMARAAAWIEGEVRV